MTITLNSFQNLRLVCLRCSVAIQASIALARQHAPDSAAHRFRILSRRAILACTSAPFKETGRLINNTCEWCYRQSSLTILKPLAAKKEGRGRWSIAVCRECLNQLPRIREAALKQAVDEMGSKVAWLAALGLPGDIVRIVCGLLALLTDVEAVLMSRVEVVG